MKQLTGLRLPVQQRVFVPDAHGAEDYHARAHLVTEVHLEEAGPDTMVSVKLRGEGYICGKVRASAADAEALAARLLRDVPRADRELFQQLMDNLQEAAFEMGKASERADEGTVATRTEDVRMARRRLGAVLDTMAADLAIASGGAHV